MAYSELIKSFERIRNYMREFYVYGFKSREEYSIKSARSYDNERRRIESWIGDFMSFHQDTSGKNVFLSVDSRRIPHNPLHKAFKAKSLEIVVDDEKVSFPWFELIDSDHFNAYTQFISAITKMAKEQKRILGREREVENEKYAFRCFLLRLGFIGDDYKLTRKILLENLEGSAAFKTKKEEA